MQNSQHDTIRDLTSLPLVTNTRDWVNDYLGKPWEVGARGPDSYDCWGLVVAVYREEFNIALPEFVEMDAEDPKSVMSTFKTQSLKHRHLDTPIDGCVVLAGKTYPTHCGVYLKDTKSILHVFQGGLSCVQKVSSLNQRGMRFWKYYTPRI